MCADSIEKRRAGKGPTLDEIRKGCKLEPWVVYPTLRQLEEQGLLKIYEDKGNGNNAVYNVTQKGHEALLEESSE